MTNNYNYGILTIGDRFAVILDCYVCGDLHSKQNRIIKMITNNQIKAFDENELAYLYYCCKTEWDSLNMGYEFDWYVLKAFRNNMIHPALNKYSGNLTDENKGLIIQILNKLEQNI